MLYMKACPKCAGDVELNNDWWGAFLKCVQCGSTWYGADAAKQQPQKVGEAA